MNKNKLRLILYSFLINLIFLFKAFSQQPISKDSNLLLSIISGKDHFVDSVLKDSSKYHIQLILGAYEDNNGVEVLKNYYINKDLYYFNPASLIKFPVAVVALEKISLIQKRYGISIYDSISLNTCGCDVGTNGYVARNSNKTIEQFLRELFIMSNNDAFNFFYDMVGPYETSERMRELGYDRVKLKRRFTSGCDSLGNLVYGGIGFYDNSRLKYRIFCDTAMRSEIIDPSWPQTAGKAVYRNKKIVPGPKNYSSNNYVSLTDAHDLLISIMDEKQYVRGKPMKMDASLKATLVKAMGDFPRELKSSSYQTSTIPDYYYKYFLDPSVMNTADNQLRIFNKVGISAGFISDVSYIIDYKTGIKYFISASIMPKKDQIMDNGKYNYFDIGIPFLRKIGGMVYQYFVEQKQANKIAHN